MLSNINSDDNWTYHFYKPVQVNENKNKKLFQEYFINIFIKGIKLAQKFKFKDRKQI